MFQGNRNKIHWMLKNNLITDSSHVPSPVQPAPPLSIALMATLRANAFKSLSVNLNHRREIWHVARRQTLSYRCCFVKTSLRGTGGKIPEVVEVTRWWRRRGTFLELPPNWFMSPRHPLTPRCVFLALWHVNYGQTQTNEAGDISDSTKQSLPHTHLCFQEGN